MKSLLIKNLPKSTSETILLTHFSKFGSVKSINFQEDPKNKKQKMAKISIFSDFKPESISNEELLIFGKPVKIEPFFDYFDPELAKRKICVFQIPKSYKSRKLKKIFSKKFGKVQKAFVRKKKSSILRHGYVIFANIEAAQNAVETGTIEVDDLQLNKKITLTIQKFELNDENPLKEDLNREEKSETKKTYLSFYHFREDQKYPPMDKKFKPKVVDSRLTEKKNQKHSGINEAQELKFLSQFGFMYPKQLREYISIINMKNENIIRNERDIRELELFYFNRQSNNGNYSTMGVVNSCALKDEIRNNHSLNNLLLREGRVSRARPGFIREDRKFYSWI